jgi:hypothetical protein
LTTADLLKETTPSRLRAEPSETISSQSRHGQVPLAIPSGQEYYWHFEWQEGEREVVAEIRAGRTVRFDSDDPEDVARWLEAPE